MKKINFSPDRMFIEDSAIVRVSLTGSSLSIHFEEDVYGVSFKNPVTVVQFNEVSSFWLTETAWENGSLLSHGSKIEGAYLLYQLKSEDREVVLEVLYKDAHVFPIGPI